MRHAARATHRSREQAHLRTEDIVPQIARNDPRFLADVEPDVIRRSRLSGTGTIRETGEVFPYVVRFLDPNDIEPLLVLHHEVLDCMPEPLLLYERDYDFYHKCITEAGCIVGAFHNGTMIGHATLLTPDPGEENYGAFLDLDKDDLRHVGHLAGSAVLPYYRGSQIQRLLVEVRGLYAHRTGFHHLCGEVLPGNTVSIVNHLAEGYFLAGFRIDNFGLPCFILHNDMRREPSLVEDEGIRELPLTDMDGYQAMMHEGRWGFEVVKREGAWHIRFGFFG